MEVKQALHEAMELGWLNPASQHQTGQRARRALERARESILQGLDARVETHQADRLIFTSGGTESNNLALLGLAGSPPGHILVSAIEHPSILDASQELVRRGFQVQSIPVSTAGILDLEEFHKRLTPQTRCVSVMLANHETGVIQPVEQVARACREREIRVHTDATQAVGKMPVSFRRMDVDALTFSAHKLHGPVGIGGLILRQGIQPQPQHFGGFQQEGLRPGTEPVWLAHACEVAIRASLGDAESTWKRMAETRDTFESILLQSSDVTVRVQGCRDRRLPHATNLSFEGYERQALLLALDQRGIDCSTGSACASGSSELSPVLTAMGLPSSILTSSLRFSFNRQQSPRDAVEAAEAILRCCRDLRR